MASKTRARSWRNPNLVRGGKHHYRLHLRFPARCRSLGMRIHSDASGVVRCMRRSLLVAVTWLLACATASARVLALDDLRPPPGNWSGHVFAPQFDFPQRARSENYPWQSISFRHAPADYLAAVLDHVYEGQDFQHFDLRTNNTRGWYHMPWLGPGPGGREFIHGMTRGRDFPPRALSASQVECRQNWSIAFYNETGAEVLHRIWRSQSKGPDLGALPFLDNTVAVKLVFTEATGGDDPSLTGAPQMLAAITARRGTDGRDCPRESGGEGGVTSRVPTQLRLIQVDVAVRDHRASYKTGWVFGSFRYDSSVKHPDPWRRLRPTGLMWGNDPDLSDKLAAKGVLPRQSVALGRDGKKVAEAGLGRGGRMNGVADDPRSACSSCHMASQWPSVAPVIHDGGWEQARCWFRNVDGRYPFGYAPSDARTCGDIEALKSIQSLDFSLQLGIALRNWSVSQSKPQHSVLTTLGRLRFGKSGELRVGGEIALPFK